MNIKEISDAIMNGRTFHFTGKINELSFENGKLNIDWVFPEAGKPFSPGVDLSYLELAPKYDPCRRFKKGDIVRVVDRAGRLPSSVRPIVPGHTYTVYADEYDGEVILDIGLGTEGGEAIEWYYLELVTPVEELEPYSVVQPENYYCVRIMKGTRIHSSIPFDGDECVCRTLEEAMETAQAECDRLNAEYRKEHAND